MNIFDNCGQCACQPKDCGCNTCGCDPCKCKQCGCPAPVFSIEAKSTDPTVYRYNVNGKTIEFDHTAAIKAGETATTVTVDQVNRTLNHYGEKSTQTITAKELGSILHLTDIGDVNGEAIDNYGLLNYRKDSSCGEGCEGQDSGWIASNPVSLGDTSMDYILGSTAEGELKSLIPPTNVNKFSYLTWAAQNKVKWSTPTQVSSIPTDADGYGYQLWLDPNTGEIVVYKRSVQ